MEEILDRENKRMADSLASKVTRLKSVSAVLPASGDRRAEAGEGPGLPRGAGV